MDIKAHKALSLSVTENYVVISGRDGIVRLFESSTLRYINTFPRPPPLGHTNVTASILSMNCKLETSPSDNYSDAIATKWSPDQSKITCFYGDRTMIIWNVQQPSKIGKYRSSLAHSSCIWDLDILRKPIRGKIVGKIPEDTVVTCSEDYTIRFW